MNDLSPKKRTAKDFATDQEVRWCPGCGDYAILRAVQKTLADIDADPANTVFVSGIGCAARFPYYVETYGFHTIHGRAPAFATGIKLANPELDVWVVGGDGDMLSIGGNHLMHVIRRNVDVQVLLFNNEIYGLTKGQASPTSRIGTRSPSTPLGSVDSPVSACTFVLGAGARFVARGIDTQQKVLPDIFARAHGHKGASFVEVLQNCIVYNDGVFADITEKPVAADRQVVCEHGKPLVFGANSDKGIAFDPKTFGLTVVAIGADGPEAAGVLVHDETNHTLAGLLAAMDGPDVPVAIGVIYCDPAKSYGEGVEEMKVTARAKSGGADLKSLMHQGHTWTVDADDA